MSFTRDLLTGLAELLAAAGIGAWNPTGIYGPDQTGITIGGLPASPDRAVCLTVYGSDDDVTLADSTVQVQVRMRAQRDPRDVDDLADAVFDLIHGLSNRRLGTGVGILLAYRQIVAGLDRDESGRWERADSYALMVDRPSRHRI